MAWAIDKNAHRTWSGGQSKSGHRTYKIKFRLVTDDSQDGPALAMQCPGLFLPGAPWLIDNDADPDAYCTREMAVSVAGEYQEGEPAIYMDIEQTFSTEPDKMCQDDNIENPLLRPQQKSGGSSKHKEEATFDRFDQPILNSAFEVIRGPQVEFDKNRHQIKIVQNVPNLELYLCTSLENTVNAFTLWGMPPRCVYLSQFDWEEKFYGTCFRYYTRSFTFETNIETFDRTVLDEGTKVLAGEWNPAGEWIVRNIGGSPADPDNPTHFIRFQDRQGNPARVLLDGAGLPADVQIGTATGTGTDIPFGVGKIKIEKYRESDFLMLGIPTIL